MIVETLRQKALPTCLGLAVALSVMTPAVALADKEPAPSETLETMLVDSQAQSQLQTQLELPAAVLDSCDAFAHQANVTLVLKQALSLEGSPYAYGGITPRGFDCSGFTQYCFRTTLGIELPRTAAGQAALGESVSMDELQPGDLLFWGSGSGVYHVGIYVEDGTYIHAAGSGKGVRVQTMDYFQPTFAKRII